MPSFSKSSKGKLETCDPELQTLFLRVVQTFDCTVISGHRKPGEQYELYKLGRRYENGIWVIDNEDLIVTYKDGYKKKSEHNYIPSRAVDVVPYPVDFDNMKRMRYFVGYVKGIARILKDYGAMEVEITTGIDWDNDTILRDQRMVDAPHFQLR